MTKTVINNKKSLALQEKAVKIIPGMTQLLSKRPDRYSRGVWPTYFKEAKGVEVVDLDDNRYLDFSIGGIGATVLGYADEDVNKAVIDVINKGSASTLNPPEEVALAEKLLELHPWADMARFSLCTFIECSHSCYFQVSCVSYLGNSFIPLNSHSALGVPNSQTFFMEYIIFVCILCYSFIHLSLYPLRKFF